MAKQKKNKVKKASKKPETVKNKPREPKTKKIVFTRPKGTRDLLPPEPKRLNLINEMIRKVFERYGYEEIETPAFESLELLEHKGSIGDEAVKDIYRFEDKSGRKLGLKFEPTTPIVRIIVSRPEIAKPVRWSYFTRMWRYEEFGRGRYREFNQAGIELIGSSSEMADAEILQMLIECFLNIGIDDFILKVNDRKIIESFLMKQRVKDTEPVIRILDKMEKKEEKEIKAELREQGLTTAKINDILKFVRTDPSKIKKNPYIKELDAIIGLVSEKYRDYIKIDFSVSRGLDYYTGMVFEVVIPGFEEFGSLAGGGRYDDLVHKFGGSQMPAIGFGIGTDRIISVLEAKGKTRLPERKIIYIAPVSSDVVNEAMSIATKLREKHIVETGFPEKNMSKHLSYASGRKASFVVIVGPKDVKEGYVTLRDMKSGNEARISISYLSEEIKTWHRTKLFY